MRRAAYLKFIFFIQFINDLLNNKICCVVDILITPAQFCPMKLTESETLCRLRQNICETHKVPYCLILSDSPILDRIFRTMVNVDWNCSTGFVVNRTTMFFNQ